MLLLFSVTTFHLWIWQEVAAERELRGWKEKGAALNVETS